MKIENFTFKLPLVSLIIIGVFSSCIEVETETSTEQQKKVINTDKAPASVGVYSQAIQVGNTLYLSGQIGLIPESRELAGDDLNSQTHQTLNNIKAVLEEAGFAMSDVVKAQVFLDDMDDYGSFNDIYIQYFPENPPARAVVEVSRIPLDAKVEIMVTAVKN
ncbi:RidA family protein [Gracilimonas sp.]|uniref:RidA family protein n=1 Tax=Gracilimonas sp. TaxID=1974203 RepID=UPI0032EF9A29